MAAEGPLNQSINKAQRHYSSLFFLPSLSKGLLALAIICILTGASLTVNVSSLSGLLSGLLLGLTFFGMTFLSDLILSRLILRDPIFNLRRCSVLSLASWLFWFVLIALGLLFTTFLGSLWLYKMYFFGFSVVLTLRTIVFFATLSTSIPKRFVAILLQPFVLFVPFIVFWGTQNINLAFFSPLFIVLPLTAVAFGYLFLHLLNSVGKKSYGFSSLMLFRAFMLNWVTSQNEPLETFLEKLGEDADIEVSMLKFDSQKPVAMVIVPLVHPGPFKNIGSSVLPSLLKHAYEKEYGGNACVPLGLLGHERNAASQVQNEKIISDILNSSKFKSKFNMATPLVRVTKDSVTASCQIFGKTALLSFTLAPKTTEDLPQELGIIVSEEAKKLGLEDSVLINAHNSLTNTNEIEASIETLREVASECLKKAVFQQTFPFKVGSATIYPKSFTLKEGMGEGGITAIVISVDVQKTAYIIIDGNNMISGLREKILSELASSGFDESEVFTTDTHSVSALVRGRRGYHPIGEVMNNELLINCIKEATQNAFSRLEICNAGFLRITVNNVRVMGKASLEPLTGIVDKSIHKAKRIAGPIFASEAIILLLLLSLI